MFVIFFLLKNTLGVLNIKVPNIINILMRLINSIRIMHKGCTNRVKLLLFSNNH